MIMISYNLSYVYNLNSVYTLTIILIRIINISANYKLFKSYFIHFKFNSPSVINDYNWYRIIRTLIYLHLVWYLFCFLRRITKLSWVVPLFIFNTKLDILTLLHRLVQHFVYVSISIIRLINLLFLALCNWCLICSNLRFRRWIIVFIRLRLITYWRIVWIVRLMICPRGWYKIVFRFFISFR